MFYRSTARTKLFFRPWEIPFRAKKKAVGGHCSACVQASILKPYRFQRPALFTKKTWSTYLKEKLVPELLRTVRPVNANTRPSVLPSTVPSHARRYYLPPAFHPTRFSMQPHIEFNPGGPSGPGSQLTSVEDLTSLAHRSRPIYGAIAGRAQVMGRL